MKVAIFNPYLDTLGGGERYTLSFAKFALEKGYKVDIQWQDLSIKRKLEDRFGMDLEDISIVRDIKRGDGYDCCFWVSDGSISTLRSRKNILHFQIPFHDVGGQTLINKMKLIRINKIVCNSNFTKRYIDKEYGVNSIVIYPPASIEDVRSKRKSKTILFVGRFSQLKQNKKQDVLINAFKKFIKEDFSDWELVLVGGIEVGVGNYLDKLEKLAKGLPIKIIKSPDYRILKELYEKSKIFWSATGFNTDEQKEPEKTEHFGISLVEAMSAGCIPIVYKAGGYKEIINHGENGYLWKNTRQLVKLTKDIVKDNSRVKKLSLSAKESSQKYSYESFKKAFSKII